MTKIRYEVIYKNLVREMRKYYSTHFNENTNYIKRKKNEPVNFMQVLKEYCEPRFGDLAKQLELDMNDIVFNLGAMIYPKEMLKQLKYDIKLKVKVVTIYNYLYKFSLERLQHFVNNKCFVLVLIHYLKVNGFARVRQSPTMEKYYDAYIEAYENMLTKSSQHEDVAKVINI